MKTQRPSATNPQDVYDNVHKKDIIMDQGDWNAKVGIDSQAYWGGHLWTLLQPLDQRQTKALGICCHKQLNVSKYPWDAQIIKEMDMVQL